MKNALARTDSNGNVPHIAAELLFEAQRYLNNRENNDPAARTLEAAWREFYDLCTRKIRSFAFSCGTVENEIHDCIQDVWTTLIARLPTFQLDPSRGQFESWLFCIVQSKASNLRRSRKRTHLQDGADHVQMVADNHTSPSRHAEAEETAKLAWDLICKRLSEPNLQILQLRLVQELPGAEVAKRVGLTHEQVRYRYHRARRELQEIGATWPIGPVAQSNEDSAIKNIKETKELAQQKQDACVSRAVKPSSPVLRGGPCVDYVFQRVELGRRELTPEWKVEWKCDGSPTPILYIRMSASMIGIASPS